MNWNSYGIKNRRKKIAELVNDNPFPLTLDEKIIMAHAMYESVNVFFPVEVVEERIRREDEQRREIMKKREEMMRQAQAKRPTYSFQDL